MQNQAAPAALKITNWTPTLAAHTRGGPGDNAALGGRQEGAGTRWLLNIDIAPLRIADALAVRAWLHSLRGRAGTCVLTVPGDLAGAGNGTGTLTGNVAAGDTSLTVTGATAGALIVGNLMHIADASAGEGQLLRIVTVAGSSVTFRPALRSAYLATETLTFGAVAARWRIVDVPAIPLRNSRSVGFSIDLEEAY
jgi:hypothetical protein